MNNNEFQAVTEAISDLYFLYDNQIGIIGDFNVPHFLSFALSQIHDTKATSISDMFVLMGLEQTNSVAN